MPALRWNDRGGSCVCAHDGRSIAVRLAVAADLDAIRAIYNQGIEDRRATLESDPKSEADMREWYARHDARYVVIVAEREGRVAGWASLSPYSHRCAYSGVAELSVYVARDARGSGVGSELLSAIEEHARRGEFHKIVLFALAINDAGERLYAKMGYRDVGVFREQGRIDGRYVDVVAKEKIVEARG
jgi:phosphinothricin acetyltransferase